MPAGSNASTCPAFEDVTTRLMPPTPSVTCGGPEKFAPRMWTTPPAKSACTSEMIGAWDESAAAGMQASVAATREASAHFRIEFMLVLPFVVGLGATLQHSPLRERYARQ